MAWSGVAHARSSVALGFTIAMLAGCKQIEERIAQREADKKIEAATSGKVDAPTGSGTVTVHGETGGVIAMGGDTITVPTDWPASVPTYPSGTLKGSMSANGDPGAGKIHHTLTYVTPDDAAKVLQFYVANLKGYTKSSEVNLGGNIVASFEGDGKVVALTISKAPAPNVSMLNVMVTNRS